jgi:thiol-disulfide isomerase/thioredoxin
MRKITVLIFFIFEMVSTMTYAAEIEIIKKPIKLLSGATVTLEKLLQKRPVYLKFWASWCQPCREQMPHLQHTFDTYGDRLDILAINLDVNDDIEHVTEIQRKFNLTVPIAIDSSGEFAQAFDLKATPYHLLLTQDGRVVFRGHEVTDKLENKIGLLANNPSVQLKDIPADHAEPNAALADAMKRNQTILLFTATWCDWYLKDTRPAISKRCIRAQEAVNELYKSLPSRKWMGVTSRLWTVEHDLQEYQQRYSINHDIVIDTTNEAFFAYNVKEIPTLLILNNGIEQFRTSDFNDLKMLKSAILSIPPE